MVPFQIRGKKLPVWIGAACPVNVVKLNTPSLYACGPLLQLHGQETPERVAVIKARTGLRVMKAIAVAEPSDIAGADAYGGIADEILFDAKASPDATLPGGNGVPFDWRALTAARPPFVVSGGLNPDNVGEAIRLTGPALVDVSSGVETAPGMKDEKLVVRFIQAAQSAAQQQAKAS